MKYLEVKTEHIDCESCIDFVKAIIFATVIKSYDKKWLDNAPVPALVN